jgi:hypothetical protein
MLRAEWLRGRPAWAVGWGRVSEFSIMRKFLEFLD